jgi:hypothetical protein
VFDPTASTLGQGVRIRPADLPWPPYGCARESWKGFKTVLDLKTRICCLRSCSLIVREFFTIMKMRYFLGKNVQNGKGLSVLPRRPVVFGFLPNGEIPKGLHAEEAITP